MLFDMWRVFVFILMICFACAVDVDFDCSDEIYTGEEFSCDVAISDGNGLYDLKIAVDEKRDSVLEVWDGKSWRSSYYYLKDFVRDEKNVRLKVSESGRYNVVLKLRKGKWKKKFDVGRIRVLREKIEDKEKNVENGSSVLGVMETNNFEIISLEGDEVNSKLDDSEWDYVSKDGMVVDWLPYLFCLFLIFLVGVLVWDRF